MILIFEKFDYSIYRPQNDTFFIFWYSISKKWFIIDYENQKKSQKQMLIKYNVTTIAKIINYIMSKKKTKKAIDTKFIDNSKFKNKTINNDNVISNTSQMKKKKFI